MRLGREEEEEGSPTDSRTEIELDQAEDDRRAAAKKASMDERFMMRLTWLSWAVFSSAAPFLELEWDGGGEAWNGGTGRGRSGWQRCRVKAGTWGGGRVACEGGRWRWPRRRRQRPGLARPGGV